MKRTEIKASPEAKYLSDFLSELPHNCLFNKVLTGAGGTYIALTSEEHYIICVPFISLIENKCYQHRNVLGVYGKVKDSEIKRYLSNKTIPVKKIMVTYDSLVRIMNFINPLEYKLLIDELHILFQSITFRSTAVFGVLENYTKFKSFCFMTATMLEDEFIVKELKHLPIVDIKWDKIREVTVQCIKCKNDVIHATTELINGFLDGSIIGNAYIFVNSVLFMKDMIRICKLNDENARAVWSDNNLTKTGLLRGKTTDKPKKINFFSSVSFQGVDLDDVNGKTYVISDKSRCHSLLDISTSFTQIVNRIRNTQYWDTITHIFTTTRYDIDLDYDQFKKYVEGEIVGDLKTVDEFNLLSERSKNKIKPTFTPKNIEKADNNSYIVYDGEKFSYDENLMKYDLFNFKVTKHLYKLQINLVKAYEDKGFNVEMSENLIRVKNAAKTSPKETFRETVIECKNNDKDFYQWACQKYPFLAQALDLLGYDGIEEFDYHISNIKRKLQSFSNKNLIEKAYETLKLNNCFVVGKFYSTYTIKVILSEMYNEYGITITPTATTLKDYYRVKATTRPFTSKDGTVCGREDGFLILK